MVQGAADGVTWVVGFVLIADLYGPEERGRVMGYVMSGTSVGIVVGPSIGGWLYEAGGVRLPFVFVAVLALVCAVGFLVIRPQPGGAPRRGRSIWSVVRVPGVAICGAMVVVAGGTIATLELVLPLFLNQRLTLVGLVLTAVWMPLMAAAASFQMGARRHRRSMDGDFADRDAVARVHGGGDIVCRPRRVRRGLRRVQHRLGHRAARRTSARRLAVRTAGVWRLDDRLVDRGASHHAAAVASTIEGQNDIVVAAGPIQ